MHLFLQTLHVLAAVFLAGPLVIAPMTGLRALRAGDERGVREAVRTTWLFGLLSLVIAGLGMLVVAVPDKPKEYGFGTPWVIISTTLYILVLAGVLLAVVPALRSAARLLAPEPVIAVQPDTAEPGPGDTATFAAAADTSVLIPPSQRDPAVRTKLDALRGRIAATSGIVAVLVLVIAILMVTKPFGH